MLGELENGAVRMSPFQLKSGMIVATDVMSIYGEKVVSANTMITTTLIKRIMLSGAGAVYVFTKPSEEYNIEVINDDIKIKQVQITYELNYTIENQKVNQDNLYRMVADAIGIGERSGGVDKYLKLLQQKDEYTYTHCLSVSIITNLFAKWYKLNKNELFDLTVASSLHDIGKLSVDMNIIEKPGALTNLELHEMKKHVLNGCKLLESCNVPERVKLAVSDHHERLDGTGYPNRKRREDISIMGNMLSIVDVYDALVSNRSYREAMSPFAAMEVLVKDKFHAFNFQLLEKFIENIVYAFMGAHVLLNDGRYGEIVFINPNAIIRPFVRVEGGEIVNLYNYPNLKIDKVL